MKNEEADRIAEDITLLIHAVCRGMSDTLTELTRLRDLVNSMRDNPRIKGIVK